MDGESAKGEEIVRERLSRLNDMGRAEILLSGGDGHVYCVKSLLPPP
jgi:hypothetical protein